MSEEAQPPNLVVPVSLALCIGVIACVAAFARRKFLLLFFTGGSIWVEFLIYLYRKSWPGIPFVPGRRKVKRGIAIVVGLLIFGATWYIVIWLDPSLRN